MFMHLRNNVIFQTICLLCFLLIGLGCLGTEEQIYQEITPLHHSKVSTTESSTADPKTKATFDDGRLKSALVLCKNYQNSPHFGFIETADQIFFNTPDSSKVRGAGIIGSIGGLLVEGCC